MRRLIECFLVVVLLATNLAAQEQASSDGDRMLAEYFRQETAKLSDTCLADIGTLEEWQARRSKLRGQLLDMLGLDPLPERTELKPTVTARTEHGEFVVERLHFQSRPGLYVTGNLYLPKQPTEGGQKWPVVLYLCGHGGVKKDGVSYGNKVHYQRHGSWFARHGLACLTIDSLQLGEIEAIHHGTYRYHMWWWLNRGYTPAGVEAWNCVRALDYLQSRDDVDAERIGVTGRSGGGAYSWWIAAIDDRVKAAVPVAGITDLQNHVVDGCVEGHCDCMYFVNTYRWDYPLVAALVAPRPLLISNSDRDSIFPLEGVIRTHAKVRQVYELYGAADQLALQITAGPHQDTQELRVHAFRWLNHHLKDDDSLVQKTAVPFFEPEQLQVFADGEMPEDEQNTSIQETFVPVASAPELPADDAAWAAMRDGWRHVLESKVFAGWPHEDEPLELAESFSSQSSKLKLAVYDFTSQSPFRLRLLLAHRPGLENADMVDLHIADESDWPAIDAAMQRAAAKGSEGGAAAAALPDFFAKIAEGNRAVAVFAPAELGPLPGAATKRNKSRFAGVSICWARRSTECGVGCAESHSGGEATASRTVGADSRRRTWDDGDIGNLRFAFRAGRQRTRTRRTARIASQRSVLPERGSLFRIAPGTGHGVRAVSHYHWQSTPRGVSLRNGGRPKTQLGRRGNSPLQQRANDSQRDSRHTGWVAMAGVIRRSRRSSAGQGLGRRARGGTDTPTILE